MDNGAVCGQRTVAFAVLYFVLGFCVYMKLLVSIKQITDFLTGMGLLQKSVSLVSLVSTILLPVYYIIKWMLLFAYFFIRVGLTIFVTVSTGLVIMKVIRGKNHKKLMLGSIFTFYCLILQVLFTYATQMILI